MSAWHERVDLAFIREMREAVANYMRSEGCSCCSQDAHERHEATLGKLLGVAKYDDGSGYDWSRYETKDPR